MDVTEDTRSYKAHDYDSCWECVVCQEVPHGLREVGPRVDGFVNLNNIRLSVESLLLTLTSF